MSGKLEKVWLLVQITLGCGVILGGAIAWQQGQMEVIKPTLSGMVGNYKHKWFYSDAKNSCDISAILKVKNEGKDIVKLSEIGYEVYAISDNITSASRGTLQDTSGGKLFNGRTPIVDLTTLIPSEAILGPNGSISRDIAFNFHPDSDKPAEWYSNHRLAIKVVSRGEIVESRKWCFFCPTKESTESFVSRLQYFCG
jgi:hypothetical protein